MEGNQNPSAADVESAAIVKDAGNKAFALNTPAGYKQALLLYTQSIESDGTSHITFSNRSATNLKLGKVEAAITDANVCIRLEPAWAKGYCRLGAALLAAKRYSEADAAYAQGVNVDGTSQGSREGMEDVARVAEKAGAEPSGSNLACILPGYTPCPLEQCSAVGCTNMGTFRCGGCGSVRYCSQACAKASWKTFHARMCKVRAKARHTAASKTAEVAKSGKLTAFLRGGYFQGRKEDEGPSKRTPQAAVKHARQWLVAAMQPGSERDPATSASRSPFGSALPELTPVQQADKFVAKLIAYGNTEAALAVLQDEELTPLVSRILARTHPLCLLAACEGGEATLSLLQRLVEQLPRSSGKACPGLDVRQAANVYNIGMHGAKLCTPLLAAIRSRCASAVELLLQAGATTSDVTTSPNPDLLRAGADRVVPVPVLAIAAKGKYFSADVVNLLIQHQAPVLMSDAARWPSKRRPLHSAIDSADDPTALQALLQHTPPMPLDADTRPRNQLDIALEWAIQRGAVQCIRVLLLSGARLPFDVCMSHPAAVRGGPFGRWHSWEREVDPLLELTREPAFQPNASALTPESCVKMMEGLSRVPDLIPLLLQAGLNPRLAIKFQTSSSKYTLTLLTVVCAGADVGPSTQLLLDAGATADVNTAGHATICTKPAADKPDLGHVFSVVEGYGMQGLEDEDPVDAAPWKDSDPVPPLAYACMLRKPEVVTSLVKAGARLDLVLPFATMEILSRQVPPGGVVSQRMSPLACLVGYWSMTGNTDDRDADCKIASRRRPVYDQVMRALLVTPRPASAPPGSDLDCVSPEPPALGGWTPLHYAALRFSSDTVALLLDRVGDKGSLTPSKTPTQIMIRAGAGDRWGAGVTPMHLAGAGGSPTSIKLLVEAAARWSISDAIAARKKTVAAGVVLDVPLSKGVEAVLALPDVDGRTIVHQAGIFLAQDALDCLRSMGAPMDKKDKGGKTAAQLMAEQQALPRGIMRKRKTISMGLGDSIEMSEGSVFIPAAPDAPGVQGGARYTMKQP